MPKPPDRPRMGRPQKGAQKRCANLPRVEPRVLDIIRDDAEEGETVADTITRWADARREEKA